MLNSTDLKNGTTFLKNGKPYKVIKYSLIKMGRGGATVKVRARNLENGAVNELSFSSNVKVDDLTTQKRKLQYLYSDTITAYFMDPNSFEQIEISKKTLEDDLTYLKEGDNINVLFWDEKPLSIELAPKVILAVTETDPGVKGNSATNVYKPARLENGLEVKVPLFIDKGDRVVVDTRNGEYVERAK